MYKVFVISMITLTAISTCVTFIINIKNHYIHWMGVYKVRYVLDKMPDGISYFFYQNAVQDIIDKESSKITNQHIFTSFIYDINSLIILKCNNRETANE